MKWISILWYVLTFISIHAANYGTLCATHGECQEKYTVQQGTKCFKVKTGVDYQGHLQCTIRCYQLPVGIFCYKKKGEGIGVCKREEFSVPQTNPNDPNNCVDAVDSFNL